MFFILSKTLNYLTMPFTVICCCFLVAVIIRNARWKKRFFWVGFSLLFFLSNDFIANEVMAAWEPDAVAYADLQKKYTWGIVLTGVTISGRTPNDRVYFSAGADRVTHTVQLYKLGWIEKILVSGGSGRLIDTGEREADDFRKAMLLMGVNEQDIVVESRSRNTHESAVEVRKMADSLQLKPQDCILITSASHMRRSIACFKKAGLKVDTFATDFHAHSRLFTPDVLIVPKLEAMGLWHKMIREWVGLLAYRFAGYV